MASHTELPFCNVGGDPETHTISGKTVTKRLYDPIVDDEVEREFSTKDREFRTFSVAINGKDGNGEPFTRWIRCVDWADHSRLVRKGDTLSLWGTFRTRTYQKDGATKTTREFIVHRLSIERAKLRNQE